MPKEINTLTAFRHVVRNTDLGLLRLSLCAWLHGLSTEQRIEDSGAKQTHVQIPDLLLTDIMIEGKPVQHLQPQFLYLKM